MWKVKVNSCRVLPNTAAVGWRKSCMGFYSWTPKYPRWEQVRWMNLQCKEPLIICPFSLRIVTLDFPFLQLFDWFLSVVLEFSWNICLSLTVYVWEWGIWYLTGLDVCRRACTLVGTSLCDWVGIHLFFLGDLQLQSPLEGNVLHPPGHNGRGFFRSHRVSHVHCPLFSVLSDACSSWARQSFISVLLSCFLPSPFAGLGFMFF